MGLFTRSQQIPSPSELAETLKTADQQLNRDLSIVEANYQASLGAVRAEHEDTVAEVLDQAIERDGALARLQDEVAQERAVLSSVIANATPDQPVWTDTDAPQA